MEQYYNKTTEQTITSLESKETGLTTEQVQERLQTHGQNILKAKKKINPLVIFFQQFHSAVVYILIAAVIISIVLGEYIDSAVIIAILIFNAIFGFIQEYKAEKSIEALKRMASLQAKVLRDNKVQEIDAKELVPGDILLLEEGDKIPADARILESIHMQTLEAALTGESTPVTKHTNLLPQNRALGDQKNMVFSGTVITAGRGKAIITATGMNRQIGKIAKMIETAESGPTPLQNKLDKLGKHLGVGTIFICFIVFGAAVFKGEAYLPAFLAAVALAVAAIPEGLPAVVTISLAMGVQRMIKKNALIRKLPSVETLGCTTVICTDKTGTLTKNEMTVKRIYTNGNDIEVTGTGYQTEGEFFIDGKKINPEQLHLLLKIGALNNNATIEINEKNNNEPSKVIGDPTEGCLLVSAQKGQVERDELQKTEPRIDEIIFTSTRKRMSTVHKVEKKILMYTKGAPDIVLNLCTKIYTNGKIKKITAKEKEEILEINKQYASTALRVLAFAYKECKPKKNETDYDEADENNLVFVGLQGMIDPPREEVKESIATCKVAGIRVVMITGDYGQTALAIGKELGIGTEVMTGEELTKHNNIEEIVEKISIYARVNPEHKLQIVEALQKRGHVVAMTGDGVNDAPALKKADIGVAMGITGTDVSKEASDMILTDDNFTSIVSAVEEGRGIYGNIKKYFSFLLSGNIAEVLIVFIVSLLGFPLPLIATQILLINLVTDGFPALALGVDPFERGSMKLKPRKRDEPLWRGLSPYLFIYPAVMTVCAIAVFSYIYIGEGNLIKAQTMTFLTICFFEMFQAFACRSTIESSFKVGLFKNHWLLLALGISGAVALGVTYIPTLQTLFGTVGLSWMELGTIIVISTFGAISIEVSKGVKSMWGSKETVVA
jgi:P-type Ca2+ transporter type 2C